MRSEGSVQRLWAVHEIQQLAYLYAWAFDSRDEQLLLSLWAEPDPDEEHPKLPTMDLRSIRRDVDLFFDRGPTVMFVGNHLIEFDAEDRAHGLVYGWPQVEEHGAFVDQQVVYRDRYALEGERWLFRSRTHLLRFGREHDRNPYDQPAANWPRRQVGRGVELCECDEGEARWFSPRVD